MRPTILRAVIGQLTKRISFSKGLFVRLLLVSSALMLFVPSRTAGAGKAPQPGGAAPAARQAQAKPLPLPTGAASLPVEVEKASESVPHLSLLVPPSPTPSPTALNNEFMLKISPVTCAPWQVCNYKPDVEIRSVGKLKGSRIISIQVQVGEQNKQIDGDAVVIRLPRTTERGDWLRYWAVSEGGELSAVNMIKYVNYKTSIGQEEYYFAMLGAEWANTPNGSLLWEIFPSVNAGLPTVLEQPLTADYLYTTNRYGYLAGRLILSGKVDARSCSDGGLNTNGYATPCGEKQAAKEVLEWQNRYDAQIYAAAVRYHVPARVLKAMIAQETQFWPSRKNPYEIGLGSITENGVEMLLAWNQSYFLPLCMAAYGNKLCAGGYFYLRADYQVALRRAVWEKVSTQEEIDVLGAMLFASAAQVNQMVYNTMYTSPGDVSFYEDMWKITVANYHSGSGCVGTGMLEVARRREILTWELVNSYMLGDCKQSILYVEKVWRYANGQN
jgi:hypothetical protein